MHKTLVRQIKKYLGENNAILKEQEKFFNTVSNTYIHADEDRALIESSLELSSKELNEINEMLRGQITTIKKQAKDLEIFNEAMIGRELKMVDLKKKIRELTLTCEGVSVTKKNDTNRTKEME